MGSETSNEETIAKDSELEEKKIRFEIARKIYDEVLAANLHQSEIAARLLAPVAFLTAAAAFLFNFFLDNNISVKWMKIDFIPVLFLLYILFTLGGVLVIFEIIGPSFYEKKWPSPKKGPRGPKSALFFRFISEIDINEWIDYFYKKETENPEKFLETAELQDKLIYDFAVESRQLAKKAQGKVKDNLLAHLIFYPSFCSLFLMGYTGVVTYLDAWNWFTIIMAVVIVGAFGYIESKVARKYRKEAKIYKRELK